MDIWLKFTNTITIGNISAVITIILFLIYGYYRIRRYLALQHSEFLSYVASLTESQTARIEACIHKLPSHPENPAAPPAIVENPPNGTKVL